MSDPVQRAAEFRARAEAAELLRAASTLTEVRAKHERARDAWTTLADAEDARQAQRLEVLRSVKERQEQLCGPSDYLPAGASA